DRPRPGSPRPEPSPPPRGRARRRPRPSPRTSRARGPGRPRAAARGPGTRRPRARLRAAWARASPPAARARDAPRPSPRVPSWPPLRCAARSFVSEERPNEIDRQREDERGVLLRGDLGERLQVAELQGHRVPSQLLGRLRQRGRRLALAVGVDDLGALLALGL